LGGEGGKRGIRLPDGNSFVRKQQREKDVNYPPKAQAKNIVAESISKATPQFNPLSQ
jgi:hypothetical protein